MFLKRKYHFLRRLSFNQFLTIYRYFEVKVTNICLSYFKDKAITTSITAKWCSFWRARGYHLLWPNAWSYEEFNHAPPPPTKCHFWETTIACVTVSTKHWVPPSNPEHFYLPLVHFANHRYISLNLWRITWR